MIIVRRVFAVFLTAVLAVVFGVWIVSARTADAALDTAFAKHELQRVDAYEFTHDVLLPLAVDELLAEQRDWLPDNFAGVELPAGPEAQAVVLRLLRDVFPPEFLRQQAELIIDQLIPYLAGRTDSFEMHFSVADRVNAALDHPPGEMSAVERAFRELDLGTVLVDGGITKFEEQARSLARQAGADEGAVNRQIEQLVPDRAAAAEWFTDQLFAGVDDLRPYLLGETETFTTRVSFEGRLDLAQVLAPLLDRDPAVLEQEGFVFTDRDFNGAVGGQASPGANQMERQLDILREDFVYTDADFRADVASDGDSGWLDDVRSAAGWLRGVLRWGGIVLTVGFVLAIGALGGRRWATRVAWGAGALLVVSAGWWVVFSPAYDQFVQPEVHDQLMNATDRWQENFDSARLSFVDKAETVVDDFVGGFASRTRPWMIVSALALAVSAVWAYLSRPGVEPPEWWRRLTRRRASETAGATPRGSSPRR